MDYVYFIGREEGPIKIGVTGNIKQRLAGLQCGSAFTLSLLDYIEVDGHDPYAIEKALHTTLKAKRLNGEWFDIGKDDIISAAVKVLREISPGCEISIT